VAITPTWNSFLIGKSQMTPLAWAARLAVIVYQCDLAETKRIEEGQMAVKIAQIQDLQQLDVVVAGPDDANHLFIIDGQFDTSLAIGSQGTNFATAKEIFSVLIGPKLGNRQFVRAIATASIVKTQIANIAPGGFATWNIVDVDADWDDESGQVELRIEAQVSCLGSNQSAGINGFAFHVTILAALPAD
jgi:hypothetical protein